LHWTGATTVHLIRSLVVRPGQFRRVGTAHRCGMVGDAHPTQSLADRGSWDGERSAKADPTWLALATRLSNEGPAAARKQSSGICTHVSGRRTNAGTHQIEPIGVPTGADRSIGGGAAFVVPGACGR